MPQPKSPAAASCLSGAPSLARVAGAALFLAATCIPALALAQDRANIYVRGSIGAAQQWLKDWNSTSQVDTLPVSLGKFGSGTPRTLEVGYRFHAPVSVGVGLTSQSASASHAIADSVFRYTTSSDASLLALYGTVTCWLHGDDGFYLSDQLGIVFGKATMSLSLRDSASTPARVVDEHGAWDRTWWMIGVAMGYERHFRHGVLGFVEVGYRYQDLGPMKGTIDRTFGVPIGSRHELLLDGPHDMGTDFSGVRALVGLGYRFRLR